MIKLFAVYDVKSAAYLRIVEGITAGEAARGFSDACKNPSSPMAKHPGDYSLYELGEFNPSSGKITTLPTPKWIIAAAGQVVVENPNQIELPAEKVIPQEVNGKPVATGVAH